MTWILSLLVLVQSDEIKNLRDVNPTVRKNAISTIAEKGDQAGIRPMIELLAREPDDAVRGAAVDALERLTGVKATDPTTPSGTSGGKRTGRSSTAAPDST